MKECPYCKKLLNDEIMVCSCGYKYNYNTSEHMLKGTDAIVDATNKYQYSDLEFQSKLGKKASISFITFIIGFGLSFFFLPFGLLLIVGSVMTFFLVNPGDISGKCPYCLTATIGYKKSNIAICPACKSRILVDHNTKMYKKFE